jgi:hypothetical protein
LQAHEQQGYGRGMTRPRSAWGISVARLVACAGLISLAGCGGGDLSRTIGLTRDAPDEFTVTTRAPLSMPPDFTLRPPTPGASRPQELSERQQAEAALAPQAALAGPQGTSPGQDALLSAAGPPVPNDIRNKVDSEAQLDQPSRSFPDRLMFWRAAPPPGTAVDPKRESQRLRQDAALGQSPEVGTTPIIQRPRRSVLDDIF